MRDSIVATFLGLHVAAFVIGSLLLWHRSSELYEEFAYENARMESLQTRCSTKESTEPSDTDALLQEVLGKRPLFKSYAKKLAKRQASASSLMQELLQIQEQVLLRHCANSSNLCTKGAKGQPGVKGLKGRAGSIGEFGDPGQKGQIGTNGQKGPEGPSGIKGMAGSKGQPGVRGDKGDLGTKGESGNLGQKGSSGLQGPKGDQGYKGTNGPKGVNGSPGDTGEQGPQGPKGYRGAAGVTGVKGDQGPIGPAGVVTDRNCSCNKMSQSTATNRLISTLQSASLVCPGALSNQTVDWQSLNHTYSTRYLTNVSNTLVIPEVLPYDKGDYKCLYSSPSGQISKTVSIDVLDQSKYDCSFEYNFCNWTQIKTDDIDFNRHQGPTDSVYTGPTTDHTIGKAAGYYIYLEASSFVNNHTADLESPEFPANSDFCMSFWYNMFGREINELGVYIKRGTNPRTKEWSLKGDQGQGWHQAKVTFPRQTSPFTVVIQAVEGRGYHGDIAVDDIVVKNGQC